MQINTINTMSTMSTMSTINRHKISLIKHKYFSALVLYIHVHVAQDYTHLL